MAPFPPTLAGKGVEVVLIASTATETASATAGCKLLAPLLPGSSLVYGEGSAVDLLAVQGSDGRNVPLGCSTEYGARASKPEAFG
jgi:hypothetical protein